MRQQNNNNISWVLHNANLRGKFDKKQGYFIDHPCSYQQTMLTYHTNIISPFYTTANCVVTDKKKQPEITKNLNLSNFLILLNKPIMKGNCCWMSKEIHVVPSACFFLSFQIYLPFYSDYHKWELECSQMLGPEMSNDCWRITLSRNFILFKYILHEQLKNSKHWSLIFWHCEFSNPFMTRIWIVLSWTVFFSFCCWYCSSSLFSFLYSK